MTSKSSMKSKGKAGKISAAPIHGMDPLGKQTVHGKKNVMASTVKKVVAKVAGAPKGAPKKGDGSKAKAITGSKSPSLKKAISPKPFGGKKSKKAK
jgi:hypothetical protein